jgi:Flp pilus assembly protein TadB
MTSMALALLAGGCAAAACLVVTVTAAPARRSPDRPVSASTPPVRNPVAVGPRWAGAQVSPVRVSPGRTALALRIGSSLRRWARAPADDAGAVMVGSMVLVAVPLAFVDLRLGIVAVVALRVRPVLAMRRRRLALDQRVVSELPEVIDLVRLGLASGGSTLVALRAVAARPTGPVTEALATVIARVGVGHRMADALEDLPAELGEPIRPLVRALVSSERYGVELGPTLDRLADEARDDRRRGAQARARRVPVQMLLPLVLCILPAFVVLTLVPTLVSTFETLDL